MGVLKMALTLLGLEFQASGFDSEYAVVGVNEDDTKAMLLTMEASRSETEPAATGTIAESIAEYKATRTAPAVKLLHKVLGKLIDLKCKHCGKSVSVTID